MIFMIFKMNGFLAKMDDFSRPKSIQKYIIFGVKNTLKIFDHFHDFHQNREKMNDFWRPKWTIFASKKYLEMHYFKRQKYIKNVGQMRFTYFEAE